jgi:hypothetical protein
MCRVSGVCFDVLVGPVSGGFAAQRTDTVSLLAIQIYRCV